MSTKLNREDRKFLRAVGISAASLQDASVHIAEPDETVLLLQEYGIPVTRENYLLQEFAGRLPEWARGPGPLPEGMEDDLPKELRIGEEDEDD
jgi:hypothetical protein